MKPQFEFQPDAIESYRLLRADPASEAGKRIEETVLDLIGYDPGHARAGSSRWESLEGKVWSLPVVVPDGSTWLVIWSQPDGDDALIHYIGPAPGETGGTAAAWTSG